MLGIDKFGGVRSRSMLYRCHGIYLPITRIANKPEAGMAIKLVARVGFKEHVSPWQTRRSGQLGQCSTMKRISAKATIYLAIWINRLQIMMFNG